MTEYDQGTRDDVIQGVGIHLLDGIEATGFEILSGRALLVGCVGVGFRLYGCLDEQFSQRCCIQSGDVADSVSCTYGLAE
jgi:hypothetical protein